MLVAAVEYETINFYLNAAYTFKYFNLSKEAYDLGAANRAKISFSPASAISSCEDIQQLPFA